MNKLLMILTLLCMCVMARAQKQQPEAPDTVKVIENAEKVFVSRTGDTTVIEVEKENKYGKDKFSYSVTVEEPADEDSNTLLDFEIPFGIGKKRDDADGDIVSSRHKLRPTIFALGNFYFGHRFNYFDKGNVKNSQEAGVRDVIGIRWSRGDYSPSFSIGLGFGIQWYSVKKGFAYDMDGSRLMVVPVGEGQSVRLSDLFVFNFQIPLLLSIPIGREVKFNAGGVACLNSYARARTELSVGSDKYKTTYKGIQQRLFTADLLCSVGVCDVIGVYASWSPMPVFQAPYGPQLKSWSIGATIFF